jgi:ankyrin repeat protein
MKIYLAITVIIFVVGCEDSREKNADIRNNENEQMEEHVSHSNLSVDEFFDLVRNDRFNDVVEILDNGYDVNTMDQWGNSAIHNSLNSYKMTRLLIDRGIDVNAQKKVNTDQQSPLHIACISDSEVRIVKLLLESGADPKIVDVAGKTPLDYALKNAKSNQPWAKDFEEKSEIIRKHLGM